MTHSDPAGKPKVTIEALIQLKRCERPAPEFWDRFEQELRAKQLAAIVEKRPWWLALGLPKVGKHVTRWAGPVSAAALCAVGLVAVREYQSAPGAGALPAGDVASAAPVETLVAAVPVSLSEGPSIESVSEESRAQDHLKERAGSGGFPVLAIATRVEPREEQSSAEAASVVSRASAAGGGLMEMIPWAVSSTAGAGDAVREVATVVGELPSVHFLSAILPEADHRFDGRVEVEPVVMAAQVVDGEAKETGTQAVAMMSPREVRRNRILSGLVVADNADSERSRMGQVREVFARALDEDRLYDGVRRVGMGGDRLTLKF